MEKIDEFSVIWKKHILNLPVIYLFIFLQIGTLVSFQITFVSFFSNLASKLFFEMMFNLGLFFILIVIKYILKGKMLTHFGVRNSVKLSS